MIKKRKYKINNEYIKKDRGKWTAIAGSKIPSR